MAAVPHDESATAAAISSIELFFMSKSPIIYNNFVSSQPVLLGNKHAAMQKFDNFGRQWFSLNGNNNDKIY